MLHIAWDLGQLAAIGWHDRALSAESTLSLANRLFAQELQHVVRTIHIPGRREPSTLQCALIPIGVAADAFAHHSWVPWKTLSPSLGWAHSVAATGAAMARSGQAVPAIDLAQPSARWQPTLTEVGARALRTLTTAMPPVVAALNPQAETWQLTSMLLAQFVDEAVRAQLWEAHAGGPPSRDRRAHAVVVRRVLSSLIGDPVIVVNGSAETAALGEIADELDRWSGPLTGRSPLSALLVFARLSPVESEALPATAVPRGVDPDPDRWTFDLCVAARSDPTLTVAAAQVWNANSPSAPTAPDINGTEVGTDNEPDNERGDLTGLDVGDARAALRLIRQRLLVASPTVGECLHRTQPATASLTTDQVVHLLHHELDAVSAAGIDVQLPAWFTDPPRVKVIGRATPTDQAVTAGGLTVKNIVSVDWTLALGDNRLDEEDLARLAAAKHDLIYVAGRWAVVDRARVAEALTALSRVRRDRPAVDALTLLALARKPESSADIPIELAAEGWASDLLAGLPEDRVTPVEQPDGFVGTLRPYQQRGVGWLAFLQRLGLGGVLADDMGLGKTAQVLALIAHSGPSTARPTLVICPLTVVRNWQTEAARFVPGLDVGVHHGPSRETDGFEAWQSQHHLIITTYATAAKDAAILAEVPWSRVVIDEAQHLKNRHTQAAKAIRTIGAGQRVALTGTPVENRLSDLWSIMDLVNPGVLGSADSFRRTIAVPIERHHDKQATRHLQSVISPFLLRRSKSDKSLVPELPPKIEATAWATLTPEQATLYRAVTDSLLGRLDTLGRFERRGAIVAAITKLKQICNHPVHLLGDGGRLEGRSGKLSRFDELIDDAFDADEQVIAFTQYVEMGKLVQRHLAERLSLAAPFLHGGLARTRRDKLVTQFQAGSTPLLLVSLKAGGSGLNLTAATRVIHIDRWWNPAVEDQASDRAWRIGQTQTVLVHRLATRGTIEERIDTLIEEKRNLADRVLGDDGTAAHVGDVWISELSTEELRRLITLERV